MKLQLTQNGTTVTIETERDGQTGDDLTQQCRNLALGQGYHWKTVHESMPTEEDVCEIVSEAVEAQKEDDKDMIRYELEAIEKKCMEWQNNGYKHITKKKMLDIIIQMTKLVDINRD